MFVQSCQYQLGSIHASLSCPPGTLRSFTCFLQGLASFLINSTLEPAYKFLVILLFSASSVQFSSKPVWEKQQALGILWCYHLPLGSCSADCPWELSVLKEKLRLPCPCLQVPVALKKGGSHMTGGSPDVFLPQERK